MEIQPFQVIHYPFEAQTLSRGVCPPYDKFTNHQIKSFRAKSPINYVHAILGETLQDHTYYPQAAQQLHQWVAEGILQREEQKKVLVYRQNYICPLSGEQRTRQGFFALMRLPEKDQLEVLPHEQTFSKHKSDRMSLYREVSGNPESIFVLFSDPDHQALAALSQSPAAVRFEDFHGHTNELALLDDPSAIATLKKVVEPQKLLIADGHHRFETGMEFRDECRAKNPDWQGPQPYDYILVYFAALEDPGLVILPTHRLVKGIAEERKATLEAHLKEFFDVLPLDLLATPENISELALKVDRCPEDSLGLVMDNQLWHLLLRQPEKLDSLLPPSITAELRQLPVVWLHQVILDRLLDIRQDSGAPDQVSFARTGEEVHTMLNEEGYQLAFLLRGTRPEEVRTVATSGHRMPQKSTDFYPKILSGVAAYLYE